MTYRTTTVPVRGGDMRVATWGPDAKDAPTILAVHGITSTHLAWQQFARALPDHRIIAPDLRGRGHSATLPGPWGMDNHAADVAAVADAFGLSRVVLFGHSMGGFVSVILAAARPELFKGVVLVDGGIPLKVIPGKTPDDAAKAVLGPTLARLSMTFANKEAYYDFWRGHPAFKADFTPDIAAYADYDLVPAGDALRPSANHDAIREDAIWLFGHAGSYAEALKKLPPNTTLLTCPRGLQNQTPGLYDAPEVAKWQAELPHLKVRDIEDTNHYTILMSDKGARDVAKEAKRYE